MEIEHTVKDEYLPVNTIPMLARLRELLDEHRTNCLKNTECQKDMRIRAILWLINQQFHGQSAVIDMHMEWEHINKNL